MRTALLACALLAWRADALELRLGADGPAGLTYAGREWLAKPARETGVRWVEPGAPKPTVRQAFKEVSREVAGERATSVYDGLSVITTWRAEGDTLRLTLTWRNTGAQPASQISCKPLVLSFPRRPFGRIWKWGYRLATDNNGAPGVVEARWDELKLLACVDDPRRPLTCGFDGFSATKLTCALYLGQARGETLAPGAEVTHRVSLRFAPAATSNLDLARDLYDGLRQVYPETLDWPDRRPIGALFMAQSGMGWPTNPRGWFNDPKLDVTSPAGVAVFGQRLLAFADRSIAEIKKTGGQGMICWDPEGGEMKHAITYLGDPRIVPQAAPEMDRHADAFFARFREAGLKTGVCIRPSRVIPNPNGGWKHTQVEDHVAEMADKIAYAKRRWGCTIFYMDTNVKWPWNTDQTHGMWQGDAWVLPASDMVALTQRHPDVLVFPEFGSFGYFSCVMPYGEMPGRARTADDIKAVYPRAGTTFKVGDAHLPAIWDQALAGAVSGDILLFRGWFGDHLNAWVARLHQEADYLRRLQVVKARFSLSATDPLLRYGAAGQGAPAGDLLAALAKETEWPVRRRLVEALGTTGDAAAVPALAALVRDKAQALEEFAARALAKLGPAATPVLLELLADKDPRLVGVALTAFAGYAEPRALPGLLREADGPQRVAALRALGAQRSPESVARLLAALDDQAPEVLIAACGALGKLGDKRAVEPLVKLVGRAVTQLHNNDVRYAAGEALEALTGLEFGPHEGEWQRAWAAGRLAGRPLRRHSRVIMSACGRAGRETGEPPESARC